MGIMGGFGCGGFFMSMSWNFLVVGGLFFFCIGSRCGGSKREGNFNNVKVEV